MTNLDPFPILRPQAQHHSAPGLLPSPAVAAQHIMFTGTLTDVTHNAKRSFTVLAGDGAPVLTGGWPKWQIINRPQRVGMTVLEGYDPLTLSVPILFDSMAHGDASGVERDITILEWMAGRGSLYYGSAFLGHTGDSPLVTLQATDGKGTPVPLVPLDQQDQQPWVVTDIAYDTHPLRNTTGERIRQAATVTLTQYVANPFGTSSDSATVRQQARQGLAGKTTSFKVTRTLDTYLLIAAHFGKADQSHQNARAILQANKHNPSRRVRSVRSVTAHLPAGATVRVPATISKA